jgi:hypothetical protein
MADGPYRQVQNAEKGTLIPNHFTNFMARSNKLQIFFTDIMYVHPFADNIEKIINLASGPRLPQARSRDALLLKLCSRKSSRKPSYSLSPSHCILCPHKIYLYYTVSNFGRAMQLPHRNTIPSLPCVARKRSNRATATTSFFFLSTPIFCTPQDLSTQSTLPPFIIHEADCATHRQSRLVLASAPQAKLRHDSTRIALDTCSHVNFSDFRAQPVRCYVVSPDIEGLSKQMAFFDSGRFCPAFDMASTVTLMYECS